MKDEIIKFGVDKGINKELLEQKFKEYYDTINSQINNVDTSTKKAIIQLKGFIRKLLSTPTEVVTCVVLGDSVTDFGAIMRRKYPDGVYPEGHFNAGKTIPEHEYTKTVILFDTNQNKILKFNIKHDDIHEFEEEPGSIITMTLSKGYKEGMYFFDKNLANVNVIKQLSYNEVKSFMLDKMKLFLAPNITKAIEQPNNELVIINAENIVDIRAVFDNMYIMVDDMELAQDKKVDILLSADKVKFYPGASNVIFVAEKIKSDDVSVTLKAYSAFADEQYMIKTTEMKEDVFEKPETKLQF